MIERLEGYIKDKHKPPRHEHHIDEQSIEQREQTVAKAARADGSKRNNSRKRSEHRTQDVLIVC